MLTLADFQYIQDLSGEYKFYYSYKEQINSNDYEIIIQPRVFGAEVSVIKNGIKIENKKTLVSPTTEDGKPNYYFFKQTLDQLGDILNVLYTELPKKQS